LTCLPGKGDRFLGRGYREWFSCNVNGRPGLTYECLGQEAPPVGSRVRVAIRGDVTAWTPAAG